mgnify:CR=1 FL=1
MKFDVVYGSDDKFAKVAGVSILSLLMSNSENEVTIHFLDAGLSESSRNELKRIVEEKKSHIFFYDVLTCLNKIKEHIPSMGGSFATYSRLFIADLLSQTIEKCLYIDSDTLILGDLASVFLDTNQSLMYMSYDLVPIFHKSNIGFSKADSYFNAGICLFNLDEWRKSDASSLILNLLKEKISYRFHDQDILNILFKGRIEVLDLRFNVMSQNFYFGSSRNCQWLYDLNEKNYYTEAQYKNALRNPVILHLTSVPFLVRPWIAASNHPYLSIYRKIKNSDTWLSTLEENKDFSLRQRLLQRMCSVFPKFLSAFVITLMHKSFYKKGII